MKKQLALLGAAALGSAIMFTPDSAQAADWIIKEDSAEKRPWELGILVGLPFTGNDFQLDPGALLGIPLVDKGFVPINDSFYLEVGAWTNLRFSDPFNFGLTPFGGVRWNFHLMKIWDAYGAIRGGVNLFDGNPNLHFSGVVGTTWKFSETVGLRGEFGGGLGASNVTVGVDIDF